MIRTSVSCSLRSHSSISPRSPSVPSFPQITSSCALLPHWWLQPAWPAPASSSTCPPRGPPVCSSWPATRGTAWSPVWRSCSCTYHLCTQASPPEPSQLTFLPGFQRAWQRREGGRQTEGPAAAACAGPDCLPRFRPDSQCGPVPAALWRTVPPAGPTAGPGPQPQTTLLPRQPAGSQRQPAQQR